MDISELEDESLEAQVLKQRSERLVEMKALRDAARLALFSLLGWDPKPAVARTGREDIAARAEHAKRCRLADDVVEKVAAFANAVAADRAARDAEDDEIVSEQALADAHDGEY